MTSVVLDASALLAFLQREPGADAVRLHLRGSRLSAVNYAEVISKLIEGDLHVDAITRMLGDLGIECVPFDKHHAVVTASLRLPTRKYGLSLADRACLALATIIGLPVLTGDRRWCDAAPELDVRLIR